MKQFKKTFCVVLIMVGIMLVNLMTITSAYADNPFDEDKNPSAPPCNEILCRCNGEIVLCCKLQSTHVDCKNPHPGCNFC